MTLLILREEFVCLVVIVFILCYTTVYKIKTDNNCFLRILLYSPRYMDIYNKADEAMYVNKTEIKKKHPELCGR